MTTIELRGRVIGALERAELLDFSGLGSWIVELEGMASKQHRLFLADLCSGLRYLEIGTFTGSSLCSAATWASLAVGVDNFCEPHKTADGRPAKDVLLEQIDKTCRLKTALGGAGNVEFVEGNCWEVDLSRFAPFDVLYFDGAHDRDSQKRAVSFFLPVLAENFVLVVDDWKYPRVKAGTLEGLAAANFVPHFSFEINNRPVEVHDFHNWHNGLGVFVLSKTTDEWKKA